MAPFAPAHRHLCGNVQTLSPRYANVRLYKGNSINETGIATFSMLLGGLGLSYGGLDYFQDAHAFQIANAIGSAPVYATLGSPWFPNLPLMFGAAAILAGAFLLIFPSKR